MDNSIMNTAGYIKDSIASFLFLIAFIFIIILKDININAIKKINIKNNNSSFYN